MSPQVFGPYKILERIGHVAYRLKLPEGAQIHPTFYVSLLKKCSDSSITPVHPLEAMINAERIRELEAILDCKMIQRKGRAVTEVLIRWKNEGSVEDSWEDW